MNVKQIIEAHLKEKGFGGLFNVDGECACVLDNLIPCDMLGCGCTPGYKTPCDCEGGPCNFHVTAEKPEPT